YLNLNKKKKKFINKKKKFFFPNIGDSGAFGPWALHDDTYLPIIVVLFSFIVVVYLMNLFIGLLGSAIDENNTREAFLVQKAKIITEIELFYLFPNQRRWKNWF